MKFAATADGGGVRGQSLPVVEVGEVPARHAGGERLAIEFGRVAFERVRVDRERGVERDRRTAPHLINAREVRFFKKQASDVSGGLELDCSFSAGGSGDGRDRLGRAERERLFQGLTDANVALARRPDAASSMIRSMIGG